MPEPLANDEAVEQPSSNQGIALSEELQKIRSDDGSKPQVDRKGYRNMSADVKTTDLAESQTSVSGSNSRSNKQTNKTELGVGNDSSRQNARQHARAEDSDNRKPANGLQPVNHTPIAVRTLQGPMNRVGQIHGGPGRCRVYNVQRNTSQVAGADFPSSECITLNIHNALWRSESDVVRSAFVCPYPDEVDVHLSKPLREHGIWEPHIVQVFVAAVSWVVSATGASDGRRSSASRTVGVYDIGANVGQYSMIASTVLKCPVVAVEPYRPSIYRLHKATQLNGAAEKVSNIQ